MIRLFFMEKKLFFLSMLLMLVWCFFCGDLKVVEAMPLNRETVASTLYLKFGLKESSIATEQIDSKQVLQDWPEEGGDLFICATDFCNQALGAYQQNDLDKAEVVLRHLISVYPMCAEGRAVLTALLWRKGFEGEAKSNWAAVEGLDRRYGDLDWLLNTKGWPLRLSLDLMNFLHAQDS